MRLSNMTIGMWYKVLLEIYVTHEEDENGFTFPLQSKVEIQTSNVNWEIVWPLSILPGIDSSDCSFIFCLLHNLLPTQERLHRVLSHKYTSPVCTLCSQEVTCSQLHALVDCPFNNGIGFWLIRCLRQLVPSLQPAQLTSLNLGIDQHHKDALPTVWLTAKTWQAVWTSRVNKKRTTLVITRAILEAHIMLLRKTRFKTCINTLEMLIATV